MSQAGPLTGSGSGGGSVDSVTGAAPITVDGVSGVPQTGNVTVGLDTPLAPLYGGTGLDGSAAADGTLLIGNSAGYSLNTLTAGTGISITNGPGTITIDATGGGTINILDGNTGFATGSTVNVIANTGQGTSLITGDNVSTLTLAFTDADFNVVIGTTGFAAGHTPMTSVANVGLGASTLTSVTDGQANTAVGFSTLATLTTGNDNIAVGSVALNTLLGGDYNIAVGVGAMSGMAGGSHNIGIGTNAGSSFTTTESSNIVIGSVGVIADANTIRIGTQGNGTGQQDLCFIAGIIGVTTSNTQMVTIDSSTGQLGAASVPSVGITQIDGDIGSATGSTITFDANSNCGSSVLFDASSSTVLLKVTDASRNTIVGSGAGNGSLTATDCTGVGNGVFASLTGATNATAFGSGCLNTFQGNDGSTGFGAFALNKMVGQRNTAIGSLSLGNASATTGSYNTAVGFDTGSSLLSGTHNLILGVVGVAGSGTQYTGSESSNIVLSNIGVTADNNTIRIGTQGSSFGQQNLCFIAGIASVSVSNTEMVTIDTSTGQLGSQSIPSVTGIVTIDGDTGSVTGTTVLFTTLATSGWTASFDGASTTMTLNLSDNNGNTFLGNNCGKSGYTATGSTALGVNAFSSVTSATNCCVMGGGAGISITSGTSNSFFGSGSGQGVITTASNSAFGQSSLNAMSGSNNCAFGRLSLSGATSSGSNNIGIGFNAGSNYTSTESSNIIVGNLGTSSDNNTIRVGTQGSGAGQQNLCFVAGIVGVTTSNSQMVTIDSTSGQLGVATVPTGGIVTLNGDTGSATGTTVTLAGSGSISTSAASSTVTFALTGLTNHNVLIGAGTSTITKVAPSATSGVPLISQGAAADPVFGTAVVAGGGTGVTTMTTAYAPVCAGTTATGPLQVASTGLATSGFVLTSNGSSALPSFQATGVTGVVTINGDTGSATGSTITFNANTNAGSTILFTAASSTVSLKVTDVNNNTLFGGSAGNGSVSGAYNSGFGYNALHTVSSGNFNIGFGANTLFAVNTGEFNFAAGYAAGGAITSGSYNFLCGYNAGINYTSSESSNIIIGYAIGGTLGESNVMRIGSGTGTGNGQLAKTFIQGIAGVTASNPSVTTINTSTGQLGNDTVNFTILSTGLQLKGNNTNTAPPAGAIGEQINSVIGSGSPQAISVNTTTNITSIALTAGIWDVTGQISFSVSASTTTTYSASINTTSATLGTSGDNLITTLVNGNVTGPSMAIVPWRVLASGSVTAYLIGRYNAGSGVTAYGKITATRVG